MLRFWRIVVCRKNSLVALPLALGIGLAACGPGATSEAPKGSAAQATAQSEVSTPAATQQPVANAASVAATDAGEAPAPELPVDAINEAILQSDFVALSQIQQLHKLAPADLQESWERLAVVMAPKTLIEGLNLLGVDTRVTGPKEYMFSFFLQCTAPLKENYDFLIVASVGPEHAHLITPSKPGGLYVTRQLLLDSNPTSNWRPGEYHVAHVKMASEIIPYSLRLQLQTRDEAGDWTGNHGEPLEIGWQTDSTQQPDYVKLARLQEEFRQNAQPSPAADAAYAERWARVTELMLPRTLGPGLEILASELRAAGGQQLIASFLLRATEKLSTDYHLSLTAQVRAEHTDRIEPSRPDGNFIRRAMPLYDYPTSQWKPGEPYVAQVVFESDTSIPYRLSLITQTRDAERRVEGNVGEGLDLGWHSDASKIPEMVRLYNLEEAWRDGGNYNETIAQAFAGRWKALTADAKPQPMNEEVEIVAVETKATGEKEYTFSFLLRAAKDVGQDYHLSVIAAVDQGHLQHITPTKEGANYITRPVLMYANPTSGWKAGEYHVAQLTLETELIPYELSVLLQTRDSEKRVSGSSGEVVALGWQADVAAQ